ncbi:MAG: flagellar basal body rod protein FlgB [Pseudomonadota bacterium]
MFNFENAFGLHAPALMARGHRASVLASNLANADTPGYRARDVEFRRILGAAKGDLAMASAHYRHLSSEQAGAMDVKYRQPLNPSLDQNTVDVNAERAAFLDNALRYQASLRFLNGRISGILKALNGE